MVQHNFGGNWTASKLRCLDKYLQAYTKIMNKQEFIKQYMYIDAFAGTGWLTLKQNENPEIQTNKAQQLSLFPTNNELEPPIVQEAPERLDGSARIALKVEPAFTKYFFIEKNKKRFNELQNLKVEYPDREIIFENSDANQFIQQLCREYNWRKEGIRAVLFLDPYGMQVSWDTIKEIAKTEAIDLWYLFPLGVALNRLLKKNGNIDDVIRYKINTVLGTTDWYNLFYEEQVELNLFGQKQNIEKTANFDLICQYVTNRLDSVFAGVARSPRMLVNSKNNPLYLLCFASANPQGSKTAIKIAGDILKRE